MKKYIAKWIEIAPNETVHYFAGYFEALYMFKVEIKKDTYDKLDVKTYSTVKETKL